MSSRISKIAKIAGAAALLAACRQAPPGEATNKVPTQSPIEAIKDWARGERDERAAILCAVSEAAPLAQDCRVEIAQDGQGAMLILSRPDGGFRRVRIGADGALTTADGALTARVAMSGGVAGILIGDERYAVPVAMITTPPTS